MVGTTFPRMQRSLEADLNVCLFGESEAWLDLSEEALREYKGAPSLRLSLQVLVPVVFSPVASGLLCGVASPGMPLRRPRL